MKNHAYNVFTSKFLLKNNILYDYIFTGRYLKNSEQKYSYYAYNNDLNYALGCLGYM